MLITLRYPLVAAEDSYQSLCSVVEDFPHLRTFPHGDPGCNVLGYDVVTGFGEAVTGEGIFPAVEPTVSAQIGIPRYFIKIGRRWILRLKADDHRSRIMLCEL